MQSNDGRHNLCRPSVFEFSSRDVLPKSDLPTYDHATELKESDTCPDY